MTKQIDIINSESTPSGTIRSSVNYSALKEIYDEQDLLTILTNYKNLVIRVDDPIVIEHKQESACNNWTLEPPEDLIFNEYGMLSCNFMVTIKISILRQGIETPIIPTSYDVKKERIMVVIPFPYSGEMIMTIAGLLYTLQDWLREKRPEFYEKYKLLIEN